MLACSVTLDPTQLAETQLTGEEGGSANQAPGAGGVGDTGAAGNASIPAAGGPDGGSSGAGGGVATELPSTCEMIATAPYDYWFCPDPLTYAAAVESCTLVGAKLVTIGSSTQNDWLAAPAADVTLTNLWVGGTRDDDFVWSWPSGSVFWRGGADGLAEAGSFVRWQPGEPNNSSTTSVDKAERCLAYTFQNHDWNDRSCALELPYICQR